MDIAARLLGFVGDLLAIFAAPNRLQHVTTEAGFTEMAISLANSALAGAEALQLISTHIGTMAPAGDDGTPSREIDSEPVRRYSRTRGV
jgi:hypothetical protein